MNTPSGGTLVISASAASLSSLYLASNGSRGLPMNGEAQERRRCNNPWLLNIFAVFTSPYIYSHPSLDLGHPSSGPECRIWTKPLNDKMTFEGRVARDTIISQYVTISGLVLLLYDHRELSIYVYAQYIIANQPMSVLVLTLAAEVELVWPAKVGGICHTIQEVSNIKSDFKMSPVKCAFLINRYMCPLVLSFICAGELSYGKNCCLWMMEFLG
jgi:hypothetical protein